MALFCKKKDLLASMIKETPLHSESRSWLEYLFFGLIFLWFFFEGYGEKGVALSIALSLLVFCLAILVVFTSKRRPLPRFLAWEKWAFLLLGWLTLSGLWSASSPAIHLDKLLAYRHLAMAPVIALALSQVRSAERVTWGFVIGALLALVGSMLSFYDVSHPIFLTGPERGSVAIQGHFVNGLVMSGLAVCLALAIHREGFTWRSLILLATFLMIGFQVLVLEDGRAAYGQYLLVGGLSVICLCKPRWIWWVLPMGLISVVMVFFLSDQFQGRTARAMFEFLQLFSGEFRGSVGARLGGYAATFELPWWVVSFGVGPGSVIELGGSLIEQKILPSPLSNGNFHSDYVQLLITGGVPAVALYALVLFSMIQMGFLSWRTGDKRIAFVWFCLGLGLAWTSLGQSSLIDIAERHVIFVFLILASLYHRKYFDSSDA